MTKDLNLSSNFEFGGYWWLPSDPDKKVYGTLLFNPDEATELILEGSFKHSLKDSLNFISAPIIYGKTAKGILCTLVDAHEKSSNIHSHGEIVSTFFCHKSFIGNEHLDPDSTLFESALVEFSDFSTWLSQNPFNEQFSPSDANKPVFDISLQRPKSITTSIKSINATISFESTAEKKGGYQSRTLVNIDKVRFRPKRKQGLNWYSDAIHKFRIFVSMLVGEPVNPISIQLCTKKRKSRVLGNKMYREYLEFCAPHYRAKSKRRLEYPDILFTYTSLKKRFSNHLNNWYSKSNNLRTPYQLYFGILLQSGMPLEFRYLALLQAVESYQRLKKKNKYISDKAYEPVKECLSRAIPKTVSSDHRNALKARIRFGNEYSLRKRLNLILNSLPKNIKNKITNHSSMYVEKIVVTRNYLTHRDDTNKVNILNQKEILNATKSLKLLLLVLFLHEIDISISEMERVILSDWRFRGIKRF